VLACILTFVAGMPKTTAVTKPIAVVPGENDILSPMTGTVLALDQVPDSTFAAGLLGQGAAIIPRTIK
jgi:PTS system beta-glucosides-specific IIC component